MADEKKSEGTGQRKSAAELKEQAAKARSDKTLDKIEEEAEGRSSVEDAVEERRAELRGDDPDAAGDGGVVPGSTPESSPATGTVAEGEDVAAARRADAEAAGHLLGPPGVGEEGGPDEAPVSVQDQINKRSYLEIDPATGRQYQVRQIRTDVQ